METIHSRLLKGIVAIIYCPLEAFLNATTNRWELSSLISLHTYGLNTFDKYSFFCTCAHDKCHANYVEFTNVSTYGLINEAPGIPSPVRDTHRTVSRRKR